MPKYSVVVVARAWLVSAMTNCWPRWRSSDSAAGAGHAISGVTKTHTQAGRSARSDWSCLLIKIHPGSPCFLLFFFFPVFKAAQEGSIDCYGNTKVLKIALFTLGFLRLFDGELGLLT